MLCRAWGHGESRAAPSSGSGQVGRGRVARDEGSGRRQNVLGHLGVPEAVRTERPLVHTERPFPRCVCALEFRVQLPPVERAVSQQNCVSDVSSFASTS